MNDGCAEGADAVLVLTANLALGRDDRQAVGAIEGLASGEEPAVYRRDGADTQGVAPAAPYGHPVVERGPLGGLQLGGAEEVGDLAGHVEGDRQLRWRGVLVAGRGVLGIRSAMADHG
ncbi:hypothetical protein [Streptomyces griseus]|uniref:hypothetical protein n=1 Tax=Streptomyces griseus TaxID=1911 RepID=UPI00055A65A9|nr:hypothetical protein [Streptomyces griseus]